MDPTPLAETHIPYATAGNRRMPSRFGIALLSSGLAIWPLVLLRVDVPVAAWVHDHAFSAAEVRTLAVLRWPGHFLFTLCVAGILLWRRREWTGPTVLLIATAAASLVTAIAKYVFGRNRPFKGRGPFDWLTFSGASPLHLFTVPNLSFPSGDVTLAFATAAVVARLEPQWRWPAYVWAFVVAATRVLQGAHYPADALGGAIVGTAVAWAFLRWLPVRSAMPPRSLPLI